MYHKKEDVFYYLTLENENYIQPLKPENVEEGIIRGMYHLHTENVDNAPKAQLLASGSMVNEVLAAARMLKEDWQIHTKVWSVTSYSELHREAEDKKRWNILHPDKKDRLSYVSSCLKEDNGPVIAVSDYVKLVAEQIAPYVYCPFVALGTDGFGRSDTREELRKFFEVNRYYIIMTTLDALSNTDTVNKSKVSEAIEKYNLNSEKPNPVTV